jgi:hypothetical protein
MSRRPEMGNRRAFPKRRCRKEDDMSELRSRLALAHRRAVLTVGGSLAALASMTIVAGAASHQPAAAAAKAGAGPKRATASQTAAALRDLWVDHIFGCATSASPRWTRTTPR